MTISICVSDTITIKDVVGFIKDSLRRFVALFQDEAEDESEQGESQDQPEPQANDPPTLGINVSEVAAIKDVFGNR